MAVSPDAAEAAVRLRGIALFCGALVLFTLLDSAAKYSSRYLPALEIAWVRFFVHALIAVAFLRPWRNLSLYRTRRPIAHLIRAAFLFGSTVFNFMALRTLQLDQTTAIMFAAAFVVPALSGPVLGEWIGPRRWVAVAIGFVGVLVVLRPGTASFQPAMLYSLGAMMSYVGYILYTRHLSATDSAEAMILVSGIVPTLMLFPLALPVAELPPSIPVAAALIATGLCGALGHWMLIHAQRVAPAPVLSPFLYTQLIWMTIAGYVFFGQLPDRYTLFGAGIIVASALYILYRERVHGDR